VIVEYKKANIYAVPKKDGGPLVIMPGSNVVPDDVWSYVKKHPTVQSLLSAQFLVEVLDGKGKSVESLAELSGTKAVELVEKTYDEGLLESWIVSDKRKGVQKAIEKQLQRIVIKPKAEVRAIE
jgi:hypothetical protein